MFPYAEDWIFDLSDWIHGTEHKSANNWYKIFLSLFLKHGILFENFVTTDTERKLTREVILPTIKGIIDETGMKPLIVALEPTHIESDSFWHSYPFAYKKHLASLDNMNK